MTRSTDLQMLAESYAKMLPAVSAPVIEVVIESVEAPKDAVASAYMTELQRY